MMLNLFPPPLVDISLLTAVLVGVLLVWALSELFGWHRSGLVVPGYLAGVFVIQPMAGFVIVVEATLTWLVSALIIEILPRILPMERAFGRARFLTILLVSVALRLAIEGESLAWLASQLGLDWSVPLHSLGLVLVPLAANAMWHPGWFRGIPMVAVPTLIVYLLLVLVLLPGTNLAFTRFELIYENLSLHFIAAPRVYMLLLFGAFFAYLMGVRFGWDVGGIIIPGLLAITWIHPLKLLCTLAEVLVIVALLRLLLRLPGLRKANISGLRPLVLGFVAAYLVKFVLGWATAGQYPGFRITDLFGFGYLLPSLMAVRCWRRGSAVTILVPAMVTSFCAFVAGSAVGVFLERSSPPVSAPQVAAMARLPGPARHAVADLLLPPQRRTRQAAAELEQAWQKGLRPQPHSGEQLQTDCYPDGAVLHSRNDPLLGSAWIRPDATSEIVILVPRAAKDPGLAEAASVLTELLGARALLLSPGGALKAQARRPKPPLMEIGLASSDRLSVAKTLPEELPLERLARLLPDLELDWNLDRGEGLAARLELTEDTMLDLAVQRFAGSLLESRLPLLREGLAVAPPIEEGSARLASLERSVLQPLLRARDGDERWAQLAAASAARMDLAVSVDSEVIALGPTAARAPPRFTLWLRKSGGSSVAFEVRAGQRHHLTAELARSWWVAWKASALLVHDAGADADSLGLRRAGSACPETTALWALAADHPGLTVVSLAAILDHEFPGSDVVLSIGRPIGELDLVPDYLERVRQRVAASGASVAHYDGSLSRLRFYDSGNQRARAVRTAGGHYVTVYLSAGFRQRYATHDTSSALRALLAGSGIPLRRGRLQDLLAGPALEEEAARRRFDALLQAHAQLTASGHPAALRNLQGIAERAGLDLSALEDEEDGQVYLLVADERALLAAPLVRADGQLSSGGLPELRAAGRALACEVSP